MRIKILLISLVLFQAVNAQKIFPGAVGFGTDSRGAYGSNVEPRILRVNTLDDGYFSTGENSGTFSWCLGQNFPRIVIFEVGGVIDYTGGRETIDIRDPYISIYGQTAPQPGIIIKSAYIQVEATDVLIQHLKLRIGDEAEAAYPSARDNILIRGGSDNVVVDHCSFEWSIDENVGFASSEPCNFTVSNCLIAEPLFRSIHCESDHPEQHNLSFMVAGKSAGINFTSYRNIITKTKGRNPRVSCENAVIANNLVYGQGGVLDLRSPSGSFSHVSVIGNEVIYLQNTYSNQTASQYVAFIKGSFGSNSSLYVNDNHSLYKDLHPSASQWDLISSNNLIPHAQTSPHNINEYNIIDVDEVEASLIETSGAFYWERDYVDELVIQELIDRDTSWIDSPDTLPARASVQDQTWIYYDYGDMENGYNWSQNPETLIVNGESITLNQNTTSVQGVIDYLNSVLPDEVECVRMNGYQDLNWVRLQTKEVGPSAVMTLAGDALLTLGRIPSGTYRGVNGKGYGFTPTSRPLAIPANPHGDDNSNGYTNIEEWIYNRSFIDDDINHAPILQNAAVSITDETANGTVIHTLNASDPDAGQTLSYEIYNGNSANIFAINSQTGAISVVNGSSLMNYNTVTLRVSATDDGNPALSANGILTVNISHTSDVNIVPQISNAIVSISDELSNGSLVHSTVATDPNPGQSLSYQIVSGNTGNIFSINANTGQITVGNNAALGDYNTIYLGVSVTDDGEPSLSANGTITININHSQGGGDNIAPTINHVNTLATFEDYSFEVSIDDIDFTDPDDQAYNLSVHVLSGTGFTGNGSTITPDPDFSGYTSVELYVSDDSGAESNHYEATLFVAQINDPPVVSNIPNQIISNGEVFQQINLSNYVEDLETPDNEISWSYSGNSNLSVNISGSIATISPVNSWVGIETITFTATDIDNYTPLSASDQVTFTVLDPNNEPPVISSVNELSMNEDQSLIISLNNLDATDPDGSDNNLSVQVVSGANYTGSGNRVTPQANYYGSLSIELYVIDEGGAESNHLTTSVTVNPVNDAPAVSNIPDVAIAPGESFPTINLSQYVSDLETPAENINWTYKGNSALSVSIIGGVASIAPLSSDWTGSETIIFTAMDNDISPLTASDAATFSVTGSNFAPVINDQTYDISKASQTTVIGNVIASDANSNQSLTYTILSGDLGYFSINPSTGELSLVDFDIFEEQLYSSIILEIEVTDNGTPQYSDVATVVINIHEFERAVYIDPSSVSTIEDGSLDNPYKAWNSVIWTEGNTYLQKRGTRSVEGEISIEVDNVFLGSYGHGYKPIIESTSMENAIRCADRRNVSINGLEIIAEDAIEALYFIGSSSDNIKINKCTISGGNYAVRITGGENFTLCYNEISGNPYGVYSLAKSNTVYYNLFIDNAIALEVTEYSTDVEIYNNVFSNNLQAVFSTLDGIELYNNIFDLEMPGSVSLIHSSDIFFSDNNIFYPVSEGFIKIAGTSFSDLGEYSNSTSKEFNSLDSDPLFVDKMVRNFSVEDNSPSINAGVNIGITEDMFGQVVPIGNNPDIGLAESQAGSYLNIEAESRDEQISFEMYPNPSKGEVWINYDNSYLNSTKATLLIFDAMGREILLRQISDKYNEKLTLSDYSNGMYTVQIITETSILNKKLVISK